MTMQEVKKIIYSGEKIDVECKKSENSIAKSAFESYSAFANTNGGYIFLGVNEDKTKTLPKERFIIKGLTNATKQLEDFWNTINGNKVSANILNDEDVFIVEEDNVKIIVIKVPRADYKTRPVYVNDNPYKGTFKRNHEGDYHAKEYEVKAMIRDQNPDGNDGLILEHYTIDDLDSETFRHYRTMFMNNNPGHVWNSDEDQLFLENIGGYRKDRNSKKEGLTLAGLLMFGKGLTIRDEFDNILMDFRDESMADDDIRWNDRITYDGTWENNLFNFFLKVLPKLTSDIAKPFKLENQQRIDDTSIHKAVREAFVNLIIHSDYLTDSGVLKIIKKKNGFEFTNPGTLLLPMEEIFKGGNSKSRNPRMQTMLRLVGFGDNAGSGFPAILKAWKSASWTTPDLQENTELNQVTLTLESIPGWMDSVSELVNRISIISLISDDSMAALKQACSYESIGLSDTMASCKEIAQAMTKSIQRLPKFDTTTLSETLNKIQEMQEIMKPVTDRINEITGCLSEQLRESAEILANSAEKSAKNQRIISKRHREILSLMDTNKEYTTESIAEKIGLKAPRTRQLLNELVDMEFAESLGTTKDRRYKKTTADNV